MVLKNYDLMFFLIGNILSFYVRYVEYDIR